MVANRRKIIERRPTKADKIEWRCIVDFAKRHQLVPTGKRLEKRITG